MCIRDRYSSWINGLTGTLSGIPPFNTHNNRSRDVISHFLLNLIIKVLDDSHERAMFAWANSWISDRPGRMSKQGDSPNYEYGGSCGSAKGAQQLTFMYRGAAFYRSCSFFFAARITRSAMGTLWEWLISPFSITRTRLPSVKRMA